MSILWGKDGLTWLFYVPSFICGTLIGGSIAFVFLKKLSANGMLAKMQTTLGSASYGNESSIIADSVAVAAFGVLLFTVIKILTGIFGLENEAWNYLAWGVMAICVVAGAICFVGKGKKNDE